MKTRFFLVAVAALMVGIPAFSQEMDNRVFDLLNLDCKGLERVKEYHCQGDDTQAAEALLQYYRNREGVRIPGVDPDRVKITNEERKMADESLEHRFFVHKGYQPSYFYGEDIDWTYWPVRDNELRWQLHRHKWFTPLAKAYRVTGDEKYAAAYVEHYTDWLKKNPYPAAASKKKNDGTNTAGNPEADDLEGFDENARYAWRPLEVSERINTQPEQFLYLLPSKSFSPEFLTVYLTAFWRHCDHIMKFFSAQGNHRLFEAQRLLFAGIFFPEFKDAESWRRRCIEILNEEITKQVYEDGMQFELDPHYHLAAINIFTTALTQADINGYKNEFPRSYTDRVEKMIEIFYNISFPDYSVPMFGDNRMQNTDAILRNYDQWAGIFPDNRQIAYFGSGGKKGKVPPYTSKAFRTSGFYILRNGWDMGSTVMIIKAGPPAFWHCQPDNGTFDLMIRGRNFFSDSGCYIYGGDQEILRQREWFRQTMIHKTLTLDNRNLERTDTKCLMFETGKDCDILVVENPSYEGLTHRRSVFFVDKKYFVMLDEAIGEAKGMTAVHYQMGEDHVTLEPEKNRAYTTYEDGNNVMLSVFSDRKTIFEKEEGWISYEYNKKSPRAAFAVAVDKQDGKTVRFITVIMPIDGINKAPRISARVLDADETSVKLQITVDGKARELKYTL